MLPIYLHIFLLLNPFAYVFYFFKLQLIKLSVDWAKAIAFNWSSKIESTVYVQGPTKRWCQNSENH